MIAAVRVLFSCSIGDGHLLPLVPLAEAFAARGDEVAFATAEAYRERVEASGFTLLRAGYEPAELEELHAPYRAKLEELPFGERRPWAFTWRFGLLSAPAKLPDLLDAAAQWQPDLVVHESADLAAPIVAAAGGIPSAHHGFGRIIPREILELAGRETEALWRTAGVEPEPFAGVYRGAFVDICPPRIQGEAPPAGVRVEPSQPCPPPRNGPKPAWLAELPDRPIVYVTLGTVFNAPEKFRAVLTALAELDCNVVATIGSNRDPSVLGPLPANAVVRQYVPQAEILPHVAVAVGHGGSGSTLGALAHGVPLLLLPAGADQFENAAACRDAGVARVLLPDALDVDGIRAAVEALLSDPSYRAAAEEVAAEIAARPSAPEVAAALSDGAPATRPRS
jgi:UDP:flavonoid glycosyltransferase YjiC (YdhE family)